MAHALSSAASEDDYLMTESDAEGGPPRAARRGPGLSHLVTVMVKPSSLRDNELTYPSGAGLSGCWARAVAWLRSARHSSAATTRAHATTRA